MDAPHRPKNRHFSLRRSILPLRQGMANGKKLAEIEAAILTYINFALKRTMLLGRWQRPHLDSSEPFAIDASQYRRRKGAPGTPSMNRVRGGMSAWI
jgi:hypothetical protein